MSKSLGLFAALIGVGSWLGAAYAGPNAGGTLIVALSEGTVYTSDVSDAYCVPTTPNCESAVTSMPVIEDAVVLNILAALPPEARLKAIAFGWSYPASIAVVSWSPCGDLALEVTSETWPESGSGTQIVWLTVQIDEFVEVYWAAVYAYESGSLVLRGHPTQGGLFADDTIPPIIDPIAGFGTFGFGMPGSVVCPVVGGAKGACCFANGTCEIATETDCAAQGGLYQGDGTVCEGNCIPVPTQEESWGGIKSLYR